MDSIVTVIVIMFGLAVGSFLNVVIYRLPKNLSIVRPRSRCPHCHHTIHWHHNIPVISYLALRGRCHRCHERISWRYPLVEILTAALFMALYAAIGWESKLLIIWALAGALIASTFIDVDYRIIPDEITLPGMALGLLLSVLVPSLHGVDSRVQALGFSLLGLLVGGGSLYLTGIIGNMAFRKESMGGGDVKLLAMAGTILGWQVVFLAFFIAPLLAIIPGLIVLATSKSHEIPYGPFLSLALIAAIFMGDPLLEWLGIVQILEVGVPEVLRIIRSWWGG